jgi:L-amino acid N-acyltransferase YncA
MIVREADQADAEAIAAIYAHHVLHGTATFDTVPPLADDWRSKIVDLRNRHWPFVVAVREDRVAGYAFATQFRDRPAYVETCENSIYVAPDAAGRGLGTLMLEALVQKAQSAGFCQMIAVIGGAEPASIALHRKLGFVHAGTMRDVGRKFGRLLDTVYMQRTLGSSVDALV